MSQLLVQATRVKIAAAHTQCHLGQAHANTRTVTGAAVSTSTAGGGEALTTRNGGSAPTTTTATTAAGVTRHGQALEALAFTIAGLAILQVADAA